MSEFIAYTFAHSYIVNAIGGPLQMMPGDCGHCLTSPGTGREQSQGREGARVQKGEDRGQRQGKKEGKKHMSGEEN